MNTQTTQTVAPKFKFKFEFASSFIARNAEGRILSYFRHGFYVCGGRGTPMNVCDVIVSMLKLDGVKTIALHQHGKPVEFFAR